MCMDTTGGKHNSSCCSSRQHTAGAGCACDQSFLAVVNFCARCSQAFPVFHTLLLACIILNENQTTKKCVVLRAFAILCSRCEHSCRSIHFFLHGYTIVWTEVMVLLFASMVTLYFQQLHGALRT